MRKLRRLLGAAAVIVVAGCASLPTSGSVHVGRTLPGFGGVASDQIRAFPSGPLASQTAVGIVTGFLDAQIDNDNNYAIARLFLAPGTTWNTSTGITLYNQNSEVVTRRGSRAVEVTMTRVGVINPHAQYRVAPGRVELRFRVDRRSGQWRITRPPAGVWLSTSDAQRSLQPANLYYLNAAQTRLVPTPVLVPLEQPGIATTLVTALFNRPPRTVAAAATTAAPEGLDLLGNVPITADGVAEVDVSGGAPRVSLPGLQRLSAQIVWTLRQIPGLTAVRLLDNGTPLTDVGVPRVQPIDSWQQFDPDTPPAVRGALVSLGGVVHGVGRQVPNALAGHHLFDPTVSATGDEVAALRRVAGRASIVVGAAAGRAQPRLSGAALSAPQFAPDGEVFVISGRGPGAEVVAVPGGGAVEPVGLPAGVQARGVSAIAISRDGSRAALVVGPPGRRSLMLGALSVNGGVPSISRIRTVLPGTRDARSAAWDGASTIVTTAINARGRRAVVRTGVDGYRPQFLTTIGLPANPHQVTAAPGQPILTTAGSGVWSLSGGVWERASTGRDPSYAG